MPDATDPPRESQPPDPSETDPLIGTLVVGRYRVRRLLGEGGMGQVYWALHEAIEKPVALKILRPEYSQKREIVTRFHQEAISASRIKHPNVLDVFDFGQLENGRFFLAMELLEGQDLADELVACRNLSAPRSVQVAVQIAKALAAAHSRGVVHRDLKPENVFLHRTSNGEELVKIVDFGIAQLRVSEDSIPGRRTRRRITRAGMIFGTPEYMAPEQAAGSQADFRADIYSLGVMLYEMVSGAVPFTGTSFMGVLSSQINDPVPPLRSFYPDAEFSSQLEALILAMLSKSPDARPASMAAVVACLAETPEARSIAASNLDLFALGGELPVSQGDGSFGSQRSLVSLRVNSRPVSSPHGSTLGDDPRERVQTMDHPDQIKPSGGGLGRGRSSREIGRATREAMDGSSQTNLEAETIVEEIRPNRPTWRRVTTWISAGLGVTVLGFMVQRQSGLPFPPPVAPPLAPRAVSFASTRPRFSAGTVNSRTTTPSAAVPVASSGSASNPRIRLTVESVPPGAVVYLDGAQVCGRTPCEVNAWPEQSLVLEARLHRAAGRTKVLAQRDQTVVITLAKPQPRKDAPEICERFNEKMGIKVIVPCAAVAEPPGF